MTFGHDATPSTANEWARANVKEAMDLRGWNQAELAQRIGQSQPWLSKRLTGVTEFQLGDLDLIAPVFGMSPAELLQPGYGQWDRRSKHRRQLSDRRRAKLRPGLVPHFPPRDEDEEGVT